MCEFHHISTTTNNQIPETSGRFDSDLKWMREYKKANGDTIRKISHVLMQSHLATIHLTKPHWEGFRLYAGDVKNEPI